MTYIYHVSRTLLQEKISKYGHYMSGRMLDAGSGSYNRYSHFFHCNSIVRMDVKEGNNVDIVGSADDMPFKDNEFDGIWAVNSLLHIDKNKFPKVIAELSRILKPDGLLYVRVKEGEDEGMVIESHYNNEARFFSFWKKDELLPIFEKYFSLVKFDRIEFKGTVYLEFFFGNGK